MRPVQAPCFRVLPRNRRGRCAAHLDRTAPRQGRFPQVLRLPQVFRGPVGAGLPAMRPVQAAQDSCSHRNHARIEIICKTESPTWQPPGLPGWAAFLPGSVSFIPSCRPHDRLPPQPAGGIDVRPHQQPASGTAAPGRPDRIAHRARVAPQPAATRLSATGAVPAMSTATPPTPVAPAVAACAEPGPARCARQSRLGAHTGLW